MKEFFKNIISKDKWLIEKEGFKRTEQGYRETIFTIGNGYVGSRGALEEIPYDSYAGTYIAGIFDNTGSITTEMVNAPNPVYFRITTRGEKIDPLAMDVAEHKQVLDMNNGILFRKTTYLNHKKQRLNYQSMRFFSMHNKHIGVMRIYLTPVDASADITLQTTVDTSVTNTGLLTEGRKRHFQIVEIAETKNLHYTCVETFEKNILISYACKLIIEKNGRRVASPGRILHFKIKKGETMCFTKIFSIYASFNVKPNKLKAATINSTKKAAKAGFENILKRHTAAWREKWRASDISIDYAPEIEKILRFNLYHMIISGNREGGRACIGARTLSGEGYRGHVFWDFEIFMLPFFIYTDPETARSLLLYRCKRLDKAREIARRKGFRGAMFPWESADTGEESTPAWSKGLDGSVVEIHTMDMEHHITADIAYAINHYYTATGDEEFMLDHGLEIIFAAARFWSSRVSYDSKRRRYEIKGVIGPDEFHENVNNNAYTNIMAKWSLLRAIELYRLFLRKRPKALRKVTKKIKLGTKELKTWRNIAARLITHIYKNKNLIEAFDGYFKLKDVAITKLDNNFMPVFPRGITSRNVDKTQLVKQADVVMLLNLFSDVFESSIKKKTYFHYAKRTMHKSSLSPSTHAIVGSELGDTKAYHYFLISLYADLNDTHGNTFEGMHAASLGGTWQIVINGFAGVGIRQGILTIDPKLPVGWERIGFNLKWKGCAMSISVRHNKVELYYRSKRKGERLRLRVYNILRDIPANKRFVVNKVQRGGSR